MNRRQAISTIMGATGTFAASSQSMSVVLDAASGRVLASQRLEASKALLAPPGSTLKPLVLAALLESRKLRPDETFACSGKLTIEGRSFACVHPRMSAPLDLATAIAYSCNEYVARAAQRFAPGELTQVLSRYSLASHAQSAAGSRAQLQALGEANVEVTLLDLASAYRRLCISAPVEILKGLEDAVEFGTAQHAQIAGVQVAGKTGSAASGRWAWFAGFAPSRQPKVIVTVLTQGSSGGADAAPIAGELLRESLRL